MAKKKISKKSKSKKKEVKPIVKAMAPKPINIVDIVKQAIVQVKYEEIGSWLVMHKTPLFYAHKGGFSVVDNKFIDSHSSLKKELDKMVTEITAKKQKPKAPSSKKKDEDVGYIG